MNTGDTAFMMICSALGIFYDTRSGILLWRTGSKKKNVVNTMMACVSIMGLAVVMWVAFGYSLAFGGNHGGIIGDFRWAFLHGINMSEAGLMQTVSHIWYTSLSR